MQAIQFVGRQRQQWTKSGQAAPALNRAACHASRLSGSSLYVYACKGASSCSGVDVVKFFMFLHERQFFCHLSVTTSQTRLIP
ncbi:hypothetical protein ACLKA6_016068 [Drosophila palustris]